MESFLTLTQESLWSQILTYVEMMSLVWFSGLSVEYWSHCSERQMTVPASESPLGSESACFSSSVCSWFVKELRGREKLELWIGAGVQVPGEWAASPDRSCINTAVFCCAARPCSWPVRVGHLSISQLCRYLWKNLGFVKFIFVLWIISRLPTYCHLALFLLLLLFLKLSMIAWRSW